MPLVLKSLKCRRTYASRDSFQFGPNPHAQTHGTAMTKQDATHAPADAGANPAALDGATPLPTYPATPEPVRRVNAGTPDPFAVGVRLLRMAPAWLLLTTFGCGALVLLLGWVKAGGDASAAVTLPPKRNDSRAVKTNPKANPAGPKTAAANSPEMAPPAEAPRAASSNPSHAPAQPEAQPAPAAQPGTAPAAPAQAAPPAPSNGAGDKFTVQVGSYSEQSAANEHISRLRAAGFEARAAAVELPGRGTWFRVQVGRFADRAEASKALGLLRAKGAAAGAIVAPLQN